MESEEQIISYSRPVNDRPSRAARHSHTGAVGVTHLILQVDSWQRPALVKGVEMACGNGPVNRGNAMRDKPPQSG